MPRRKRTTSRTVNNKRGSNQPNIPPLGTAVGDAHSLLLSLVNAAVITNATERKAIQNKGFFEDKIPLRIFTRYIKFGALLQTGSGHSGLCQSASQDGGAAASQTIRIMEALYIQLLHGEGLLTKEEEEDKSGDRDPERMGASSPIGCTTEEETDEDSDAEPPPVVRRKVSFADAFGLNLVSVKEFDNADGTEAEASWHDNAEVVHLPEDFYLSSLFTVPSSPEELDERLQTQPMELESIELLPGTTTLRGVIRVVNLCYNKNVYVRMSLDRWGSHFDLQAEYVPGSSDRKTDRFTFRYTLVPPFDKQGARVEFCLRYETSVGTFWSNNNDMNYVLFCHQRGQMKEHMTKAQEESSSHSSKRSCLKANRNGSGEENTKEAVNPSTDPAEVEAVHRPEKAGREKVDSPELKSLLPCKEQKSSVESVKSRRRATRLARVQTYLSESRHQLPKAFPHDTARGQKASRHTPSPWGDSASSLYKCQKTQRSKSAAVLTYHQIPLLTLDWNDDAPQQLRTADVDDILTGGAKMTLSKAGEENMPSVNDTWETFLETTSDAIYKETPVSDAWQLFLNGPGCKDRPDVPESEWLQTAVSVSPSNDMGPQIQNSARSQEIVEFQVGADTPTTLQSHTLAACQVQSDTCEMLSAAAAFNAGDRQPAEACDSSPRDDSTYPQDASQRSLTNSVTDTPQEFSLNRAPPVSEDFVDSPTECHDHANWERGTERIIGSAAGIRGDEPFTWHTADLVTSSGELETTDTTAMPGSQNASAVDRISQAARQEKGLSSEGEGEATGTAHNAIDDTLAFRDTIRQETKEAMRFAFSASRQGLEEGITMSQAQKEAFPGKQVLWPHETKERGICASYGDEMQLEKNGLNQNSGNQQQKGENYGDDTETLQLGAESFDSEQTCEDDSQQSRIIATEGSDNVPSNTPSMSEKAKVSCTTGKETEALIGAGTATIKQVRQRSDEALQSNSFGQIGYTAFISEGWDEQSRPLQEGEEVYVQEREKSVELKSDTGEQVILNPMGEGESLSWDGKAMKPQEINPSAHTRPTVESGEMNRVSVSDHITFRPHPAVKGNPNPLEVVKQRQIGLGEKARGQKEDVRRKIIPGESTVQENVGKGGSSTECHPETSEEEDMSLEDGKLKIEATRELIGNGESPQGERKNPMKGEELSAEVESSPRVEYEKLSDGREDPVRAENTALPEVIDPALEQMLIERFGEDLVRRILEEVFIQVVQASSRHANTDDETGKRLTNTTKDFHLLFEGDFSDTFDSGIFSLTETPPASNLSLFQDLEQTFLTKIKEYSPKDQPLTTTEQTQVLHELQSNLDASAHLSQDLATTFADHGGQPLSESARAMTFLEDLENPPPIKERSVTRQETGSQIEESLNPHKEGFDQSSHPSHTDLSPPSEKLKASDSLLWWTILYTISHISRLPIYTLLVSGFAFFVFLCDFPAFVAVYIFSLCWWVFKSKRHQVATNQELVR
ncbi:uncharacterized protein ppp1r3aa [Cololabis saira]|uniref:uncharacterized protein ppp1r3aa n=1 Tax=Cololabis saira TaxID=129043 RepID=UPI002AD2F5B4|nr:uncharacterized protein ppp1r3aa [Cololabis saira]